MTTAKSCPTRCAVHLTVLLCFAHCWHAGGSPIARLEQQQHGRIFKEASQRGGFSMRLHLDRKYLDGLDGNVVAFVVISLIIIIAFVY
jgi:hypothetical protein